MNTGYMNPNKVRIVTIDTKERFMNTTGDESCSFDSFFSSPLNISKNTSVYLSNLFIGGYKICSGRHYYNHDYGGGTYYPKRGSNHLAIARKIITVEKRGITYLAPINPDDITNVNEPKVIMSLVGRYKRRANKIVANVCNGQFP